MPYSTEQFLRDRFFRDNGHLISPWIYAAHVSSEKDRTLFRLNWLRSLNGQARPTLVATVTTPGNDPDPWD